nr:hypothetical protein [Synechococcus sp. CS-1333]
MVVGTDRVQGPVVVGRHKQRVELRALSGELAYRNRLANVSFDDEVTVVAPSIPVGDPQTLFAAINTIHSGG